MFSVKLNHIYHGDNLYFMPDMKENSIDLIYIDPPFGTQSLWQSKAFKEKVQELQFYDIFGGGVNGYLNFMVPRLKRMFELLKPTGSLFVHLDWRMAHYIKIELDKIFGVKNPALKHTNFVNEIIWCYKSGGASNKYWSKKHDTILFYVKDRKKYLKKFKIKRDEKSYMGKGYQTGNPNVKLYSDHKKCCLGRHTLTYPKDWWDDCGMISTAAKHSLDKRTGWPTQKPVKLLQKIIKATTIEGDLVADFFCGCGTAIVAAQSLNRKWLGFDASETACQVMSDRMTDHFSLFIGFDKKPMTYQDFKRLFDSKEHLAFEKAAVRHIGGVTNEKQVGDGGIDGRLAFDGTPIQVKGKSKPMGDDDGLRAFYMHLKQHGRGVFITLDKYTNKAKERASSWRREGLDIQLLTIRGILAGKFREQPLRPKAA